MQTFNDLKFKKDKQRGGIFARVYFANNYGASIIKNQYSYGNEEGSYEVAVLDKNGSITYTTPITKDVIGNLTPQEVTEVLNKIQTL
jgi:predicted transcriptional regulator